VGMEDVVGIKRKKKKKKINLFMDKKYKNNGQNKRKGDQYYDQHRRFCSAS
jgi:hypothetical protein